MTSASHDRNASDLAANQVVARHEGAEIAKVDNADTRQLDATGRNEFGLPRSGSTKPVPVNHQRQTVSSRIRADSS